MNNDFEILNKNDVICPTVGNLFERGDTLKVTQLIEEYLENLPQHKDEILNQGIECEVLTIQGKGWRKGKIKFIVKFEPDEIKIDSPLDDLRENINSDS